MVNLAKVFIWGKYAGAVLWNESTGTATFQVMRRLRLPYGQAEQMFRRMVFNVIARNQDDHTKNISFLMDKTGTWRLSPAYDVSWAYNPKGEWTSHHQMSINNKWDDITRTDLLSVAESMHIKRADEIIDEICNAVSMWPTIAKDYDIPPEMITAIDGTLLYLKSATMLL